MIRVSKVVSMNVLIEWCRSNVVLRTLVGKVVEVEEMDVARHALGGDKSRLRGL